MNQHHNTNIVLPRQSFIAVINYKPDAEELYIVIRKNGRRYRYTGVPAQVFAEIMQATNKGSYISQHVIKGPYQAQEMQPIPLARLERITHGNHYAKPL